MRVVLLLCLLLAPLTARAQELTIFAVAILTSKGASGVQGAAFIALVGTTITPYMQLYVQSSVVEKGVTPAEYRYTQVDVWSGVIRQLAPPARDPAKTPSTDAALIRGRMSPRP